MSRLFTTNVVTICQHVFQYISVTNLGAFQLNAFFLCHQSKAKITHNRYYQSILFQSAFFLHMVCADCHNLVTVHQLAFFIHCQHSVCISIKSDTNLGAFSHDSRHKFFHMGRTTVCVNVGSVWFCMNCHQICTQVCQCLNCSIVVCAFRTVNYNLHTC